MKTVLLLINRAAGLGHDSVITQRLSSMLNQRLAEQAQVQVELVNNHSEARSCAAQFIKASAAPALIIAGGGGGTVRAVIEGVCGSEAVPVPGPERVQVGALRMGSGNVLAKEFGVPRDPVAGLEGLIRNLEARRSVPCCVMRCEVWTNAEHSEIHHAVTLAGFGQFGRIPADLARWHRRLPRLYRGAARLFGIERLTNFEYAFAVTVRSISCILFPHSAETVEIQCRGQIKRMRLLSGVAMNFPIRSLPFEPRIRVEDEAVCIYFIPFTGRVSPLLQIVPQSLPGRAQLIKLEGNQYLEIRSTDRDQFDFFLDEDPLVAFKRVRLSVAGSIAFVPGPNYVSINNRRASW